MLYSAGNCTGKLHLPPVVGRPAAEASDRQMEPTRVEGVSFRRLHNRENEWLILFFIIVVFRNHISISLSQDTSMLSSGEGSCTGGVDSNIKIVGWYVNCNWFDLFYRCIKRKMIWTARIWRFWQYSKAITVPRLIQLNRLSGFPARRTYVKLWSILNYTLVTLF